MAAKKIIILTGEKQTGKTTTLLNWIKERNDVAGILTPVKEGKRFFYSIPGLTYYPMEAENGEEYLEVGRYRFSVKQFQKMNDYIFKWLQEPEWNYIVIDEIGPLELNNHKGLWPVFNQVINGFFNAIMIIVVRQSLSETVKNLLNKNDAEILTCSASEFQQFVN
jgi:nucleoside-triphosphatase